MIWPSVILATILALLLKRMLDNHRIDGLTKGIPNAQLSWLPWFGDFPVYAMGLEKYQREQFRKHGPIFRTTLNGQTYIFMAGLHLMKQFAKVDRSHCASGWHYGFRKLSDKHSIMNLDGDVHKQVRGVILSISTTAGRAAFLEIVRSRWSAELSEWAEAAEPLDVSERITKCISDITSAYIWGHDTFTKEIQDELNALFKISGAAVLCLPINLPFTKFGKGMAAKARSFEIIKAEVAHREKDREDNVVRQDALQTLINAYHDGKMSYEEVIANSSTILFAAVDTTASSLNIVIEFLLRHPEIVAKIRAEAIDVLGEDGWTAGSVDPKLVSNLKYTEAAIKEALRNRPPSGGGHRLVQKSFTVESNGREYTIPAGFKINQGLYHTIAAHPGYEAGAHPENFLDALDTCNSDADGDTKDDDNAQRDLRTEHSKDNKKAFSIFGYGARACPGSVMAMFEMVTMVSMLCATDKTYTVANKGEVIFRRRMFPFPADGLFIRTTTRDSATGGD